MSEHAKENCAFYPGCYYAGDCDLDDWAKQNCGLPPAMKAEARQVFRDRMTSTSPAPAKHGRALFPQLSQADIDKAESLAAAPAFPDPRTVEAVLGWLNDEAVWATQRDERQILAMRLARGDPFKETSDV